MIEPRAFVELAEMLIASEISQIGKTRIFHPSKEEIRERKLKVLAEIEEKTGVPLELEEVDL